MSSDELLKLLALSAQRLPNERSALIAWEDEWQKGLEKLYAHPTLGTVELLIPLRLSIGLLGCNATDVQGVNSELNARHLMQVQERLAKDVSFSSVKTVWEALSTRNKEDYVLQGIRDAFETPGFAVMRIYAPESTMKHMTESGGGAFLELLKRVTPPNTRVLAEPILIPNSPHHDMIARVLATANDAGGIAAMERAKLCRAIAITTILWKTLRILVSMDIKRRAHISHHILG